MPRRDDSVLRVQLQTPSADWVDVGNLHNSQDRNWFEILATYWELPNRPVLGQVFEEQGRLWQPSAQVALPNWFSHLLPEGRFRQQVAAAARTNSKKEFELLARIGSEDLPGATRVVPTDRTGQPIVPRDEDLDEGASEPEDALLKFSLAGLQLKFSVYADQKGLALPAHGKAGNVILKFPDGQYDGVPQAEHGCLRLAEAAGVSTLRTNLIDPTSVAGLGRWASRAGGVALAVDRFDRRDGDLRVHMEELAQVLNVPAGVEKAKYRSANFETVAVVVGALCGVEAVAQVIDRIVLNVLIGNGDAHLKNWAILYEDGRKPSLSPAYDTLPTVLYIRNDDLGLKLNGTRDFEAVLPSSFDRLAVRAGFSPSDAKARVRSAIARIVANWTTLADYLTKERYRTLTRRRDSLPLLKA